MRLKFFFWLLGFLALFGAEDSVSAQGSAFSYQGQLSDSNGPANGNYDLSFALFASTNVASPIVAGPITNSAVLVTNGLFTTQLNFGAGVFTGTNYWLEVSVRTNGTTVFSKLSPRQPLTPVPYAIFANTASNLLGNLSATQLSGTLPSAQIGGTYSGAVNFSNNANTFSGAFSGNGANLGSLNASQLTSGTVADARLSGNVALLNADQTFTGDNTFTGTNNLTGVNTFTNFGNSFRGSFFGNGLVGWIPTNGTSVQAVIDTGYLLTSRFYTTVTLPLTATLTAGDIVRISGAGLGGWRVRLNSGQSFFGNFASYSNSFQVSQQVTPLSGNYRGVAASADGIRMYAVGIGIVGVSASSDSGRTWSSAGLSGDYQAIACSANARIVYAVSTTGAIQKSTNSGATWNGIAGSASTIACTADGGQFFITTGVACSGNGTNQAKVSGGVITLSTNGGANFTVAVTAPAANLSCVAASSDCTRLVAGVNGGLLYGSANAGATWTTITTTNQALFGAWMSGDGTRFATAVNTSGSINGGIFNYAVNELPIGVTNSIVGSQGSAVEIQYTGNGQFMPVSSSGTIWAN